MAMARMGEGIMEAGANIGRSLQSGYEALGKGLAGGVSAAANAYMDYKKMESGVKGAEKSYEMFRPYLDPELITEFDNKIAAINSDKSLSLQDKAAFWEQAKGFIGGAVSQKYALDRIAKEQAGRENIANIMAGSRESIANLKNQLSPERPAFTIGGANDVFDAPVDSSVSQSNLSGQRISLPPSNQGNLTRNVSAEVKTRKDPVTGAPQFWSPETKRWIDEPDQNDLYFGPDLKIR